MTGQDFDSHKAKPSFWRTLRGKVTLGALLSAVVTAAGFASPEVRKGTCLELPTEADLKYPAGVASEVSFSKLASSLSQSAYDDREVVFRAKYYGEFQRDYYNLFLAPARMKGRALLNLRDIEHVVTSSPLGPNTDSIPPFAVLADAATLASLEGLTMGSVVEVRGRAEHSEQVDPDSILGTGNAPTSVALVVTTDRVQRLQPTNDPRGRWACRLIHGLKPL